MDTCVGVLCARVHHVEGTVNGGWKGRDIQMLEAAQATHSPADHSDYTPNSEPDLLLMGSFQGAGTREM